MPQTKIKLLRYNYVRLSDPNVTKITAESITDGFSQKFRNV
jgi:hypothetical protein